ncbi:undecaprenyl-diphosphate phosphatase, partial [Candidatus Uhrbacteria bacterium]|nr:undecaprenyl-diphosphate phosphatase [Candidatus Uhrbacteria bacterium]
TLRQPYVVAMSLIVWGVVLGSADLLQQARKTSVSRVRRVGVREALSIGCAQALALIPGTSRSGVTMSAGLLAGLNRETAARFSFLLSVPAVGAASLYVVTGAVRDGVTLLTPELVVGFFAALVSGVAAIRWLLRVISRYSFIPFAVYRIILGIIILALL